MQNSQKATIKRKEKPQRVMSKKKKRKKVMLKKLQKKRHQNPLVKKLIPLKMMKKRLKKLPKKLSIKHSAKSKLKRAVRSILFRRKRKYIKMKTEYLNKMMQVKMSLILAVRKLSLVPLAKKIFKWMRI